MADQTYLLDKNGKILSGESTPRFKPSVVEIDKEGKYQLRDIKPPLSEPPTQFKSSIVEVSKSKDRGVAPPGAGIPKFISDLYGEVDENPKKAVADQLPILGGLAGSLSGNPIGMGTGSFLGGVLRDTINKGGIPSNEDIGSSALQAAPDFAIPSLVEALKSKDPVLRAKLARMLFSTEQTQSRSNALSSMPDANPSVSQMTGSRGAAFLENILAPSANAKLKSSNPPLIVKGFEDLTPGNPQSRAANIRSGVEGGMTALDNKIRSNSTALEGLGNHNTVTYDTVVGQEPLRGQNGKTLQGPDGKDLMKDIVEPKKVAGPIYFNNATSEAQAFLAGMQKKYGAKSNVDLVPLVPEAQKPLVQYAQNIVDTKSSAPIKNYNGPVPEQITKTGIHPVDLQTALDWKTATGDKGYAKELGGDNTQRLWKNLNKAISSDIETSLTGWQGGQEAGGFYNYRNKLNTIKNDLYLDKSPENKALLNTRESSSGIQNVDKIIRDPVAIAKTISASSDRPKARGDLLSAWIDNVYSESSGFNPATQQTEFNASKPMSALLDPKNEPILRQLAPDPKNRQALKDFFQSVSILQPQEPAGSKYLMMKMGARGMSVVMPVLAGSTAGLPAAGMMGGVEVGLNQFVKKVLLNPEVAKLIPRLNSLPTSSPEGRAISRVIFTMLKGSEASMTKDGQKVDGTIGADGQFKPQ